MSIERAIHDRWRTCRPLADLLPVDRFFTGTLPASDTAPARPYATLKRLGQTRVSRASGGLQWSDLSLRFSLWCARLDQGKRIAAEIDRRFGRRDFDAGDERVLDMKLRSRRELPQGDGTWLLELDYFLRTETRG